MRSQLPTEDMASSKDIKTGHLILYDALTAPRRSVPLIADLLEEHFLRNSGAGGEVLLFQHDGHPIGQAMTGGDGRAVKEFVPPRTGVSTISARLVDARRVTASEVTARLFVWEQRRPLVLIAMRALWPRSTKFFPLAKIGSELPDPDSEAVKMLAELARHVGLIYVIKADPTELAELRAWLEKHHLPPGPIVLLKSIGMRAELERLKREGWVGIKTGLVSSPDEAKTLVTAGKVAVASPSASERERWPEKTVKPKDWREAGKRLLSP
jgi:hypothetical protein